jgi:ABC-type branched-subunit amino acid transport system permease subunit
MTEFLSYFVIGVSQGLIYGLLALGIVLVYKGSRVLNLAHPFFGLLAAFLAWWLTAKAGFLPFAKGSSPRFAVASIIALALVTLNGLSIEHSLIRKLRGAPRLVTLVLTIALGQGTLGLVLLIFNRTEKQFFEARVVPSFITTTFEIGNLTVRGGTIQVFLAVPLIGAALAAFFKYTKFGVAVRAAAENGESARLLGISADRVSAFTWALGTFMAGIAGLLISVQRGGLDVTTLSTGFLVYALASALVGGLTSLPGAMVGGMVVGLSSTMLEWLTADLAPGFWQELLKPELLMFVIVVAVLLFKPSGLFGQREETEDKVAFVPVLRALPKRLRDSPYPAWVSRSTISIVLLSVAVASLTSGTTVNGHFVNVVVWAILGVSLTVLMGYTGQVSLGHWALVGFGAFLTANLFARWHVPFLLTVPMVFAWGCLLSLFIGLPALRIKGLYLAIVTLAFAYFSEFTLFRTTLFAGSQNGIRMENPKLGPLDLDAVSKRPLLLYSLFILAIALFLARNIARSRTGRALFALRENEKAAATLGVDLTMSRLIGFMLSGGIAALAGSVHALNEPTVIAQSFPAVTSLVVLGVVMIGGIGSLSGAILGAFVVAGLPDLLHYDDNPWVVPIGTGILLVVILVRARGGLAGLLQWLKFGAVSVLYEIGENEPPPALPAIPTAASVQLTSD